MARLIFLGTSNAVPEADRQNTHLLLQGDTRTVLIDAGVNPLPKLESLGVQVKELDDVIVTHFHPDHVSGLPSLLMSSWLLGRRKPLSIYGLDHAINRLKRQMHDYSWENWPDFFPVAFKVLDEGEMVSVIEHKEFRIFSSPVRHVIPTIGLRVEINKSGMVLAYSSDTEPCETVVKLADMADILIHEATGASYGHSSAAQAAQIAQKAAARRLLLVHYSTREQNIQEMLEQARLHFSGEVLLARDGMELEL